MALLPPGEALLETMYLRARLITEKTVEKLNSAERVALAYLLRKIADDDTEEEAEHAVAR